ncbi:MAG: lysophospholipase [Oscillospiraceae bacterium]|nr:lysophospholipase [Oscillospiraceae bacterium]
MPKFEDLHFPSSTGKNTIYARKCIPDGTPRAVVQIEHGIAEHIDRYAPFMEFLANNGIVAVGDDHLGHGKTIASPEEQGIFAEEHGWDRVIDDVDRLRELMRREYPDLPYIFFGHSMGSFIVRTYIIRWPGRYDAAIISGTGHQGKALVLGGYTVANLLTRLKGPAADGKLLNDMAFGKYCDKIDEPRTTFDWLSRDPETVDKYIADPLCGFVAKISLYRDMMEGVKFVTDQRNIDKMNKEAPVYFMSGDMDPVGDYGAGVEKAYHAFCDAGLKDVSMKLYPGGRHEMLNETVREDVMKDILAWIDEKLQKIG